MELIKVKGEQVIARKKDKVKEWYLIQDGTVIQRFGFSEVKLSKNAIIGILESDRFLCDYIAAEDTVLAAFTCENSEDLKKILNDNEKIRTIFLRAVLEQRHQMFCLYSDLYNKTRQFHVFVETIYDEYKTLCGKYKLEEQNFSKMEHFKPLEMAHKADAWELNNSISLVKKYMKEYLQLMEKDDSLTVGVIMEAAAQMRRVTLGIGEMESYLSYNKDILMSESDNDLLKLFFDLSVSMYDKKYEVEPIKKEYTLIAKATEKLGVYNMRIFSKRLNEYMNYDYSLEIRDSSSSGGSVRKEIDIAVEDCLSHILEYAGYNKEEVEALYKKITAYRSLPDIQSADETAYKLRRQITPLFYDIYYKVFMHAIKDESSLTPVIEMFLNFGFMDTALLGEENARDLYALTAHLDVCRSEQVYTIYEWLKRVYSGEKEPSKNEFDMNYQAYLMDMYKNAKITKEQVKEFLDNQDMKVEFEIKNMFASVNKTTYGKITTFCPILDSYDIINSVEKMLVTAQKIEDAINEVRKVDYSVFYREVMFSDKEKGINSELIMKEILPDIILMPNAGTKAMMWQETAGIKSDTPGRFMFPVFTAVDLEDLVLETMGRFRWEMCRKIQGVHWNDVREKSLTAEYCTYIQFYRKNHELSVDAKEKIKISITRAKNNYREVFIKDYISFIKFESKGSFRLNKVSRDILVRYCPFVKSVRAELKANPMYQASITRYETEINKKLQRYISVYEKYKKAGGEITQELRDNMLFYQM